MIKDDDKDINGFRSEAETLNSATKSILILTEKLDELGKHVEALSRKCQLMNESIETLKSKTTNKPASKKQKDQIDTILSKRPEGMNLEDLLSMLTTRDGRKLSKQRKHHIRKFIKTSGLYQLSTVKNNRIVVKRMV